MASSPHFNSTGFHSRSLLSLRTPNIPHFLDYITALNRLHPQYSAHKIILVIGILALILAHKLSFTEYDIIERAVSIQGNMVFPSGSAVKNLKSFNHMGLAFSSYQLRCGNVPGYCDDSK